MAETISASLTASTETITASLTVADETITAELNTAARGPEGPAGSGGGGGGGGDLLAANNLSDVASASTSRTNLGVDQAGTDNSDNNATNSSSTPAAHASDTANPHSVTKAQVGLGNAENTSDASKPISTATQTGLDGKQGIITVSDTAPSSPDAGDRSLPDRLAAKKKAAPAYAGAASGSAVTRSGTARGLRKRSSRSRRFLFAAPE